MLRVIQTTDGLLISNTATVIFSAGLEQPSAPVANIKNPLLVAPKRLGAVAVLGGFLVGEVV